MFTAIVPPPDVVAAVDDFLQPRRDADNRLAWTRTESWHVTTAFMADVPSRNLERLEESLSDAAARTDPFELRLGGGGSFPYVAAARTLWFGVTHGRSEVSALATRCRNAADRAGIPVDWAKFFPHLTVARTRQPFNATKWIGILDTFEEASWQATELQLIESHLHDKGHRYETIATFPLGGIAGKTATTAA